MSSARETAEDVVRAYLGCATTRDWALAASLLEEDVVRFGPEGEVLVGRSAYLAYLQEVLGPGSAYRSEIGHLAASADGAWVAAQLVEELVPESGVPTQATEVMVFALRPEGRIASISVFDASRRASSLRRQASGRPGLL